jgi:transposase-like protein
MIGLSDKARKNKFSFFLPNAQKPCIIESSTTKEIEMAEKTSKTVNYTPEQSAQMVADYQAGVTVEAIAESLGKTVRSVVAKLSREKVYVAKTYVSKTGAPVVKKDAHADAIGAILKMTEAEIESLTKANKTALVKIFEALANSKPI